MENGKLLISRMCFCSLSCHLTLHRNHRPPQMGPVRPQGVFRRLALTDCARETRAARRPPPASQLSIFIFIFLVCIRRESDPEPDSPPPNRPAAHPKNNRIVEQKNESATVSAIRALIHASQHLECVSAVMLNRSQVLAAPFAQNFTLSSAAALSPSSAFASRAL